MASVLTSLGTRPSENLIKGVWKIGWGGGILSGMYGLLLIYMDKNLIVDCHDCVY